MTDTSLQVLAGMNHASLKTKHAALRTSIIALQRKIYNLIKEGVTIPYVSKEQIAQAREMDLLTYLRRCEPEELVRFSGDTYTTKTHDSLKISNGRWCWWSRGIGGATALDYLIHVQGLSLPDAVERISGTDQSHVERHSEKERIPPQFRLPPKHADNRRVFSYLKGRGIDPEIIGYCMEQGQLYEDAVHHNCVFVGYQGDIPRYAALRSTLPGSAFMGDVPGSDKRFSFAVPKLAGSNPALCVFEGAIDALSYLTLLKDRGNDWRKANTLSLSGVYGPKHSGEMKLPRALEHYLMESPSIETIILCLDSDDTGRLASAAMQRLLTGYTVLDNPPHGAKDYNELLQRKRGRHAHGPSPP